MADQELSSAQNSDIDPWSKIAKLEERLAAAELENKILRENQNSEATQSWQQTLDELHDSRIESNPSDALGMEVPAEINSMSGVGRYFDFVNREEECTDLLRMWWDLESKRESYEERAKRGETIEWDVEKRNVAIPVCVGMPGIGKSRFARIAIWHLVRSVPGLNGRNLDELKKVVPSLVDKVWPGNPEGGKQRKCVFVDDVLAAYFCDCDIRLACDEHELTNDETLASAIMKEWTKTWKWKDDHEQHRRELQKVHSSSRFTVLDVVKYISNKTGVQSILINIDEAHRARLEDLGAIIVALLRPLVVHQIRILISVTGVDSTKVAQAVDKSGAVARDIVLKLLLKQHVTHVVKSFFSVNDMPNKLAYSLFFIGGIPRFLEYFVEEANDKFRSSGQVKEIWSRLCTSEILVFEELMAAVCSKAQIRRGDPNAPPISAIRAAFALSISEHEVPLDLRLSSESDAKKTVADLQAEQLLYWQKTSSSSGIVRMPPLSLHLLQSKNVLICPFVERLSRFQMSMSPNDNECLAPTAIVYRLYSAFIAKKSSIKLRELIGEGNAVAPNLDRSVEVPTEILQIEVLHSRIEADSFAPFVDEWRGGKDFIGRAFINGRGASFPDAFIILPDFVLLFQEKQSTVARKQAATNETIDAVPKKLVFEEFAKLKDSCDKLDYVMIVISDERFQEQSPVPKGNWCLYCADKLSTILGSTLASLRSFVLEDSSTRASDARAQAAANSLVRS
eukprot:ANDGO_07676.mRNA.1 hypothetical protein